jgi:hypothetical protein
MNVLDAIELLRFALLEPALLVVGVIIGLALLAVFTLGRMK